LAGRSSDASLRHCQCKVQNRIPPPRRAVFIGCVIVAINDYRYLGEGVQSHYRGRVRDRITHSHFSDLSSRGCSFRAPPVIGGNPFPGVLPNLRSGITPVFLQSGLQPSEFEQFQAACIKFAGPIPEQFVCCLGIQSATADQEIRVPGDRFAAFGRKRVGLSTNSENRQPCPPSAGFPGRAAAGTGRIKLCRLGQRKIRSNIQPEKRA